MQEEVTEVEFEEEELLLSDPQYEFLESVKKHTGFVAGFGSGKSFIGTLKSLMRIIEKGIPKTAYYLPTYGDIRDIAFDTFPTVADVLGYEYKLNKSDKEFILYDENKKELGRTLFRNMSEPESIVGYQVGYTLIDETDILSMDKMDKAFKKILGRNRLVVPVQDEFIPEKWKPPMKIPDLMYYHKKKHKLCWINGIDVAGTPEGFKWFYNRFVKKFRKDTDILIQASTYSNMDNLPDDFIETMRGEYPPELFDAYVNGKFVNLTSGVVYSYFDRYKHHTDREIQEGDVLHIGQDFNVGGCCGRVHVIDSGIPKLVEEYSVNDTQSIIKHLQKRYPEHKIIIYPDASGDNNKTNASKTDIRLLKDARYKIDVPKKNPLVKNRINTVNNMFYQNKYLVNTHNCPDSTEAFEQQAYDKNGEPEKFDGANTVDDSNDANGYFIHRKFGIEKGRIKQANLSFT